MMIVNFYTVQLLIEGLQWTLMFPSLLLNSTDQNANLFIELAEEKPGIAVCLARNIEQGKAILLMILLSLSSLKETK